jgi:ATP-dependent exoDNAse (exonuclease V) beta subunit
MRSFTSEQAAAVARREGPLLLAAGAGSGKTSVLVERFARSVLEDGLRPAQILAITFTEKAAGELRARVRARFLTLGEREAARETESAWIGTIHGFCTRVLRGHAVAAGLDPAFVVLDDTIGRGLRTAAWRRAYATWIDAGGDAAVDVAAAYGVDRLEEAIGEVHDALRSAGATRPALPAPPAIASVAAARAAVERAVPAVQAELAIAKPGARVAAAQEAVLGRRTFSTYRMDALCGPGCSAYRDAVEALGVAERDERAAVVAEQLGALLDAFASAFVEAKAERSGLDFDDLQLHARDLLRDDPALRASYAERFARVMVDEFQDTNPLQLELVDLLAPGGAFVVGDEQQSIYGFRHADVEVFRARRAALAAQGATATLRTNFRSRPEILAAVNAAFAPRFGDGFMALRPGRETQAAPEPVVELLLTDTEGWDEVDLGGLPPAQAWRHAEARLLAQRIAELVDTGATAPEDVVVLLRAVGSLPVFERALQDVGLPTLAVGGRGYWGRQVVRDLCGWLAVLANPRDEIALYGVLASPLVGASTDALALLGEAGPGQAWQRISDALLTGRDTRLADRLGPEDRERLRAFAVRLTAERALAPRLGLDELLERIVDASGYDLHVLSLPNGERRLANVHKLQRLAAEHEREHGRDVRAFADLATAELEAEAREADAPVELGDVRAVRLMTIHAAKGLEFGVVCVADMGRKVPADTDDLLAAGGEVGLRLVGMDGSSVQALAYPRLRERAMAAASAEEARIAYVALTRAQERLIVSGSLSVAKWPDPTAQTAPPIAWLAPALVPGIDAAVAEQPVRDVAWRTEAGEAVGVRVTVSTPEALGTALRRPAPAGAAEDLPVAQTPVLGAPGAPAFAPPGPPATLSYSALRAWKECGYRFYLERVLGLPRDPAPAPPPGSQRPAPVAGIDLLTRGSLVHELLEELDLATGGPWAPGGDGAERLERVHDVAARHDLELTAEEAADLDALVEVVARGELRARLAAASRLQREYAFAFPLGGGGDLVMNGFVDILAVEADGTALVVDYKSDRLEPGTDLEAYVEDGYAVQRRLYALAALRTGAPRVEVVYALLDRPHEPVCSTYTQADVAGLERDLLALAAGPLAGDYRVTERPHRELCATCPGRRAMCSWPEEMTLREEADQVVADAMN